MDTKEEERQAVGWGKDLQDKIHLAFRNEEFVNSFFPQIQAMFHQDFETVEELSKEKTFVTSDDKTLEQFANMTMRFGLKNAHEIKDGLHSIAMILEGMCRANIEVEKRVNQLFELMQKSDGERKEFIDIMTQELIKTKVEINQFSKHSEILEWIENYLKTGGVGV